MTKLETAKEILKMSEQFADNLSVACIGIACEDCPFCGKEGCEVMGAEGVDKVREYVNEAD